MGSIICPRCCGLGTLRDIPVYDEHGEEIYTIDKPCPRCGGEGYIWKREPSERSYDDF